jgi:hypothetical protein
MTLLCQRRTVSVEDDKRSGRPKTNRMTETIENIWELITQDRRRAIHKLVNTVGISCGVIQEILTENLNLLRIAPSPRQHAHPHVSENNRLYD